MFKVTKFMGRTRSPGWCQGLGPEWLADGGGHSRAELWREGLIRKTGQCASPNPNTGMSSKKQKEGPI